MVTLAGTFVAAELAEVEAGLDPEAAREGTWSAKIPVMKEVLSVDRFARSDPPFLSLPETVIVGAR